MKQLRILGICGSLRIGSSNRALLTAASKMMPEKTSLVICDGIGDLPLFRPDIGDSTPQRVLDFRSELAMADAVVIASPEYAHGITGALKNALDWVVASGEFSGRPVAVLNASLQSFHAHESLVEILRTMDAQVIPAASLRIPLPGNRITAEEICADPLLSGLLKTALEIVVVARAKTPGTIH